MQKSLHDRLFISVTATLLAVPNGVIIWFIVMYPVFGITGVLLHPVFHLATLLTAFLLILVWSMYGSQTIPEVVYRSCRFGAILTLLLPVITGMISLIWAAGIVERPPSVLPEFSTLEIPVHASAAAMILIFLFLGGSFLASRKMDRVPF